MCADWFALCTELHKNSSAAHEYLLLLVFVYIFLQRGLENAYVCPKVAAQFDESKENLDWWGPLDLLLKCTLLNWVLKALAKCVLSLSKGRDFSAFLDSSSHVLPSSQQKSFVLKFSTLKNCCLFLNLNYQCRLRHFCSCWWPSAFVFKTECEVDFLVNGEGWYHIMYVETVLKGAQEVLTACFNVSLQCELWQFAIAALDFFFWENLPAVEGKIQRYSTAIKEEVKEKYRTCKLKIIC